VAVDLKKTKLIVDILSQTTSLHIISEFLKTKGVSHSAGSWESLLNKRILPAISSHHMVIPPEISAS